MSFSRIPQTEQLRLTIVDDDRQRALLGNVRPEGLQGLLVTRQCARKVAAADDNDVVRTSLCRLLRNLDRLPSAACPGPRDDGNVLEASIVQGLSCRLDERDALFVRQVVGLAHRACEERLHTRLDQTEGMGRLGLQIWTKGLNNEPTVRCGGNAGYDVPMSSEFGRKNVGRGA